MVGGLCREEDNRRDERKKRKDRKRTYSGAWRSYDLVTRGVRVVAGEEEEEQRDLVA